MRSRNLPAKRRGYPFQGGRTLTERLPASQTLRFHIHEEVTMSRDAALHDTGIAGSRVRSFVERVEQLEQEISEINEQKKEVFAEAKGEGFDVKILREIIKLRKLDKDERDEHETLLDIYMRAMESEPDKVSDAA